MGESPSTDEGSRPRPWLLLPALAIPVLLVFAACAGSPADPGTSVPATTDPSSSETSIAACREVDAPGDYVLTSDLGGSEGTLDPEPSLAAPYAGDRRLTSACIAITAPGVTLDCDGHLLQGVAGEASAGIALIGTPAEPLDGVEVRNCHVFGHEFGLFATHLDGALVTGSVVEENRGTGIYLEASSMVTVAGNTVVRNDPDGILVLGGHDVSLTDNSLAYNRMRGVTFEGCQGCEAARNESRAHGVLGFAVYGSMGTVLEDNVAHANRYHGIAILHGAGSSTVRGNESFDNGGAGFYLEESADNDFLENASHDNALDGVAMFGEAPSNRFAGNLLAANGGYGILSDTGIGADVTADNQFEMNALGPVGTAAFEAVDGCAYTGFDAQGPCDPVFEGGPNLADPANVGTEPEPPGEGDASVVIVDARIVGDPVAYPAMGDLWMPTWANDGRLFLSWGDGSGYDPGYPLGYPAYLSDEPVEVGGCDGYFPCQLWCAVFGCTDRPPVLPAPLTDAGILQATGTPPNLEAIENIAIDLPSDDPFFLEEEGVFDIGERNDKPSSLLVIGDRIHLAGHAPAGDPTEGYLAYSDDWGITWVEVPDSPWGAESRFRVLMFINMGQGYGLNTDGYVYALGVGTEASWTDATVYLARVPVADVTEYTAYEYFAGFDAGAPSWSPDDAAAVALDGLHTTGQASAMFHPGVGRFLMLTTDSGDPGAPDHTGALYEAPQPWGPWTRVAVLCFLPECSDAGSNPLWTDGKYIAGLIPKDAGSDSVFFTISGGDDHYQLQIGRLEFETRP